VTGGALVDGRPADQGALARLRRRGRRLTVSRAEQDEAVVEQRLRSHVGVTRANTVAVMSPTGGVGKTTCAFLLANVLATHLNLRVVVVDASPGFGTLAQLAPGDRHSERGLIELLDDADRLHTAAELGAYVARLTTGVHVLAARHDPQETARLGPDRYGELVALLSCFYEVVLLDLGSGAVGPLARFAARRADQLALVTTAEWMTAVAVLDALHHLRRHDRTTVAINLCRDAAKTSAIEARFLAEDASRVVTIPRDEQLATMLESGTYTLGALRSRTRMAIKRLGLAVAEQLV
jgi:MinD-like ATPase involved in chromosome partitioning or flagellar assembly